MDYSIESRYHKGGQGSPVMKAELLRARVTALELSTNRYDSYTVRCEDRPENYVSNLGKLTTPPSPNGSYSDSSITTFPADNATDGRVSDALSSRARLYREKLRLEVPLPPVPDPPNSEKQTFDPFKDLYGHCVSLRREGILEESFAADGDGFRAACATVYSPTLSAPEDFNIEEFRRWNTPYAKLWHSPYPPCLCGRGSKRLCEVCYQVFSGLKRPWYLEHPFSYGNNTLCQDCRHLNLTYILNYGHGAFERQRKIPLGPLSELARRQGNCAFCRLLVHSLQSRNDKLTMTSGSDTPNVYALLSARPGSLNVEFLSFSDHGWEDDRGKNVLENAPYRGGSMRLVPSLDINLVSVLGIRGWFRESCGPSIRMSLIKTWIKNSNSAIKGPKIRLRANMFKKLRLIDVIEQCLVEMEVDCRYMALSYVWGGPQQLQTTKANKCVLERAGGLRTELVPLTIRDAMHLTRQLGERYLWVDSLSIVQDDADSKHTEISRMDRIYENAYCTIVAAHGTTVNDGLPGLHPSTRKWIQIKETVQGYQLASLYRRATLPRPCTTWGSRGWTYQEQLLSQRLLMFESNQISFHDSYGSYHEDYHGRVQLSRSPVMMSALSGVNIEIYSQIVNEYTKRNLSFPEDIINAFLGISSKLASKFRGPFVYGLPSTEIDIALLWRPEMHGASFPRRLVNCAGTECNPSWSWAGWKGAITYSTILRTEHVSKVVWIDHRNESRFRTSDLRGAVESTNSRWATAVDEFGVPNFYELSSPSERYLHPATGQWKGQQHSLIVSPSTHLLFEAYSVSLFLAPQSTSYVDCLPDGRLLAFTHDGFIGGVIYASEAIVPLKPIRHEFIILSQSRLKLQTFNTRTAPRVLKSADRSEEGELHQKLLEVRSYIERKVRGDQARWQSRADQPSNRQETQHAAGQAASRTLRSSSVDMENMQDLSDRIYTNYSDELTSPTSAFESSYISSYMEDIPFDSTAFDEYKKWCLYNIMMIEWREGVAHRTGIGVCHIDAAARASPQLKRIVLG